LAQRRISFAIVLISIGVVGLMLLRIYPSRALSIERASNIAEKYLRSLNDPDLAISEIMEFEQNFYVVYYEKSTGIGAFEMLIDKTTGRTFPEYGPDMMWNTKYGHGGMMGGGTQPPSEEMPVDEAEAIKAAQAFLDRVYPGILAEDTHRFYGYYTIHVAEDGEISGMLSVNGYTGAVWYHNWHGAYIRSREMH